jgi:hypothetical protein
MQGSIKDTELSSQGVEVLVDGIHIVFPEFTDSKEVWVPRLLSDVLDELANEFRINAGRINGVSSASDFSSVTG